MKLYDAFKDLEIGSLIKITLKGILEGNRNIIFSDYQNLHEYITLSSSEHFIFLGIKQTTVLDFKLDFFLKHTKQKQIEKHLFVLFYLKKNKCLILEDSNMDNWEIKILS